MKRKMFFLIVCSLLLISACTPAQPAETGFLEGSVTVGPLQPVVSSDQTPAPPAAEVYTSRGVEVYKINGDHPIASQYFSSTGGYRFELPAGSYRLELMKTGIDTAKELPVEFEILAGQVTRLDLEIDTGIR